MRGARREVGGSRSTVTLEYRHVCVMGVPNRRRCTDWRIDVSRNVRVLWGNVDLSFFGLVDVSFFGLRERSVAGVGEPSYDGRGTLTQVGVRALGVPP